MCELCWELVSDGRPLCAACASDIEGAPARAWATATTAVLVAGALAFLVGRRLPEDDASMAWFVGGGAAFFGAGIIVQRRREAKRPPTIRLRVVEEVIEAPTSAASSPYRAMTVRVRRTIPRLSARAAAGVVTAALVATSTLLPVVLHLPRWIEVETVIAVGWLAAAATFATALYRGARVTDDYAYRAPWNRPPEEKRPSQKPPPAKGSAKGRGGGGGIGSVVDLSGIDGEGCIGALVGLVLAGVALGAAWLMVEIVAPALFVLVYWTLLRGLRRVVLDAPACAGNAGRAMARGMAWASVYAAPVAAIAWCVHHVLRARGLG
jgi:hypothetical protein